MFVVGEATVADAAVTAAGTVADAGIFIPRSITRSRDEQKLGDTRDDADADAEPGRGGVSGES